MTRSKTTYFAGLVLVLAAVIAWWQVAFMQWVLKYDMIDQYLPWRQFITDCLAKGILPVWNPYQHWGYFFSADPQAGVWYPLNWLYGLAGGYSVYTNQFDFMLHIVVGGIGMFMLCRRWTGRQAALAIAICYMLSGFFTGNAQHLTYLISGAWMPFVLFTYIEFARKRDVITGTRFSVCLFLLASGGYPAFTIITTYLLLGLMLFFAVRVIRRAGPGAIKRFLWAHAGAALAVGLMGAFMIASVSASLGHVSRSEAIPLHDALFNPFSPQSMLSLLFPLWSAHDPAFFDTDISMSNLYFGVFGLALAIGAMTSLPLRRDKLLLAAGTFFLLASFGGYTPVREWLYRFVPLMDLFRFPSIFRLFALLCLLVLAAGFLQRILSGNHRASRVLTTVLTALLAFFVVAFLFTTLAGGHPFPLPAGESWSDFIHGLNVLQCVQVQSLVSCVLLGGYLAYARFAKRHDFRWILSLSVIDLVIAVQLNAPRTGFDTFSTHDVNALLVSLPHDFKTPPNGASNRFSDSLSFSPPFWRNLSLLRQEPGYDGFNSFRMAGYAQMIEEPEFQHGLLASPVLYLSDSFSFYSDTVRRPERLEKDPGHLFFSYSDRPEPPAGIRVSKADFVTMTTFKPGLVAARTQTANGCFLTLKQHFHPGWKAAVNGQEATVFKSNYLFMTVVLPPGSHTVTYTFEMPLLKYSLLISFISFAACLLLLAKGTGLGLIRQLNKTR